MNHAVGTRFPASLSNPTCQMPLAVTPNSRPRFRRPAAAASPTESRLARRCGFVFAACSTALWASGASAAEAREELRPFPAAEVEPLPRQEYSFRIGGREVARYIAGADALKPYVYPVIGPCGRTLTRIGHPRDPAGHDHHLSLWIGHADVCGVDFWSSSPKAGRIRHDRASRLEDGATGRLEVRSRWVLPDGSVALHDERAWTLVPLEGEVGPSGISEYFLDLELWLRPARETAVLGKTPFGLLGARVAKTMGVADGGGRITDSEGRADEREIFWKRARWCDYSGQAAPGVVNGITLFDHPENPGHPAVWHVRDDGWMGPSVSHSGPIEIGRDRPLRLRYRFWIHEGPCDPKAADARWSAWVRGDGAGGGDRAR